MPIPFEVRTHDRFVIVSLMGRLTVDDYADAVGSAIADPRLEAGFGFLVDGRRIDPLPSIDDLRPLVQVARDLQLHGVGPFALVAGTDLQYLVGRLFTTMAAATINLNARVFRSYDVARDWLRVTLAPRQRLIEPTGLRGATGNVREDLQTRHSAPAGVGKSPQHRV